MFYNSLDCCLHQKRLEGVENMKCLLLASGFGTRSYPVTVNLAKGLLPYQGKPVISHLVEKIPEEIRIHVTTNRRYESQFQNWQKTLGRNVALCVEPVFNERQSFGAVGSLEYWVKTNEVCDDLIVFASDNYFESDIREFILSFDGLHTLVAVYDVTNRADAQQFGVVKLSGKKVVELVEKPAEPKSSLVATACYIFPSRVLSLLSEYCSRGRKDNLGEFIAHLIRCDEVHAHLFKGGWFDVGDALARQKKELG